MLLRREDHEGASVELAGGLRSVQEAPEPGEGGLRVAVVAVVVAQAAAAAVFARLGDVGAQLVVTRRMPPAAICAMRSPDWVYGELSWSAPRSA